MPAFVPPFARADVQYVDDVAVELPDPPRAPGDPIVRPGVARYAGRPLPLLHVRPSASAFEVRSPVAGTVRRVTIPGVLTGISELVEIEALPFRIASTLQRLPPGSPTFYVAVMGGVAVTDGDFFDSGTVLTSASGDVYAGVLLQDGSALAPWGWIELLRKAMADAGDAAGAGAWNGLADLYSTLGRVVRVLNHDGLPVGAGQPFSVSLDAQPAVTLTTDANSALTLGAGAVSLAWQGQPIAGDTTLPVASAYETLLATPTDAAASAAPGRVITLPSGFARGHLQALDLSRWYGVPPFDSIARRFHTDCRVEPLLDGVASFRRIVDDLVASRSPDGSAYFSGLIFNNFDIDKGRKDPLSPAEELDTTLIGLTNYIRNNGAGGEVRMQFDKFIKPTNEDLLNSTVQKAVFATVVLAASAVTLAAHIDFLQKRFPTNEPGFVLAWSTAVVATGLLELLAVSSLEEIIEPSIGIFGELNAIAPHIAIWARHPVQMADNPLADRDLLPGIKIEDIQAKFGSWHQKIQAIKRGSADTQGNRIIGYVGGIDINKNRVDTPGHQAASAYHDIHSRVTGTAAWDVHQTWRERYAFEKDQHVTLDGDTSVPELSATLPDYRVEPSIYPPHPQKHLVQIGRTYFQASGGGPALPFSSIGERTTYDTYLRALKEARTYIHLEDQYFTPNTSPDVDNPPGTRDPDVFFDVLLDAATWCKRLVVILPREGDQPFGQHRRGFLIAKLRQAWGDRAFIGVPLRRPLLPDPGVVASKGRALLLQNIGAFEPGPLIVGPEARVPKKPPFWLWIYGELMLCIKSENATDAEGLPAKRLTVVRGGDWRAKARTHARGAPVTFSQLRGPYVHAKVVMVDDVFVGIGTTNLTRRAFFHEGEIHAFAVPEQLRAAPDNPAWSLRSALWAEHLGLPPQLGPSLLGDPLAAFEYFRRPMLGGNRSTPVETVNEQPHFGGSFDEDAVGSALKNLLGLSMAAVLEPFWNTFSDSTTRLEPRPIPGPFA